MTVAVASAGPKVASGTLMLHLLGRCNLSCVHCYMEGGPTREEPYVFRGFEQGFGVRGRSYVAWPVMMSLVS
jgi:hypothetical protein